MSNVLGHPITKPVRADLSDFNISDRFGRICRNLFHYYSGSSKKKEFVVILTFLRLITGSLFRVPNSTMATKHE
ncbi:hypothetical protein MIMGU_mgv1a019155mg, partial [Erythranthe guttata]